jgi:hypothetical protein
VKRSAPEQALQMAVARFLDLALPDDAVWSAIGHGGGGRLRGAILKSMGVKPGVPDLFVVYDCRVMFIELKAGHGTVSPAQKTMHETLRSAGVWVRLCRG